MKVPTDLGKFVWYMTVTIVPKSKSSCNFAVSTCLWGYIVKTLSGILLPSLSISLCGKTG